MHDPDRSSRTVDARTDRAAIRRRGMAWNRDRCHAEKECCPGPPNDWSSQQRLQVPDQPGALLRGAHIGGFQSGAAAFLPHRQRSEAELRLSTTGGARGFAEVFRTVWAAACLSRTQLPKQRSRRRPHRPSIVSGIALNSMWTRWFAQYPVRPILKPLQSRGLLLHQRTLFVFVLQAFSRDNGQFLRVYFKPLRHTRL